MRVLGVVIRHPVMHLVVHQILLRRVLVGKYAVPQGEIVDTLAKHFAILRLLVPT